MIVFFQDGKFPNTIRLMTGVQWLKLDKTHLNEIPEEMGKLLKLVILIGLNFPTTQAK
jgi:hypothetical protein